MASLCSVRTFASGIVQRAEQSESSWRERSASRSSLKTAVSTTYSSFPLLRQCTGVRANRLQGGASIRRRSGYIQRQPLRISASSADIGAGELESDGKSSSSVRAAATVVGITSVVALGAIVATVSIGGPAALVAAVAKSGFMAGFGMIFATELGDKTFFIAALLAMRYSKLPVMVGSTSALAVMTVISVAIGRMFQKLPEQLQFTLPVGEWAAIALLVYFGLNSIKNAWDTPSEQGLTKEANEELADAEETVKKTQEKKLLSTPLAIMLESFTVVFVAEWGDRSMLATICLAATQEPFGVAVGAVGGHALATFLAVLGGSLLSKYISEKAVGYAGGATFLLFAIATFFHLY